MADTPQNNNSKYCIAVASTDGENVNCHYGRATQFYVYYIDDDEGYDFLEKRSVKPVCLGGAHDKKVMEQSVTQFTDCRYVIASRIGSGASQTLAAAGIIAMELPGTIDDAILKVWKYNQVQNLFGRA